MPRRQILSDRDKDVFDSPPIFNSAERRKFFDVTPKVQSILRTMQTPASAVSLLVRLGYFKAAKRFFGAQLREQDIEYVARKLGFLPGLIDVDDPHRAILGRHRAIILDHFGYQEFDAAATEVLAKEVRSMVRSQASPKFILLQVVSVLEHRKVEVPSSWALCELILDEVQQHKSELASTIDQNLSSKTRQFLDGLLETPDGELDGALQRSKLALLKRISQSMRPTKIKATVDDFRTLRDLYGEIHPVTALLDLTADGVSFYAKAVTKSTLFQMIQRTGTDRYLHLVCFVTHQCFRLQDTLIDIFLAAVQSTTASCEREHKELYYDGRNERRQTVRRFLDRVDDGALTPLANIEAIAFDGQLADVDKIRQIQGILVAVKDTRETAAENLDGLRGELERHADDNEYYRALESRSIKLQNRVSEIVKCVDFHGSDVDLMMLHFRISS